MVENYFGITPESKCLKDNNIDTGSHFFDAFLWHLYCRLKPYSKKLTIESNSKTGEFSIVKEGYPPIVHHPHGKGDNTFTFYVVKDGKTLLHKTYKVFDMIQARLALKEITAAMDNAICVSDVLKKSKGKKHKKIHPKQVIKLYGINDKPQLSVSALGDFSSRFEKLLGRLKEAYPGKVRADDTISNKMLLKAGGKGQSMDVAIFAFNKAFNSLTVSIYPPSKDEPKNTLFLKTISDQELSDITSECKARIDYVLSNKEETIQPSAEPTPISLGSFTGKEAKLDVFSYCEVVDRLRGGEKLRARIPYISKKGELLYTTPYEVGKEKKNIYSIGANNFKSIRCAYGVIALRIPEKRKKEGDSYFGTLNEKSILKEYGYEVGRTTDVTKEQRRFILRFLLQNRVITKDDAIKHLRFNIKMHGGEQYDYACDDWRDDIRYLNRL